MAERDPKRALNEGYVPVKKGYEPKKVQGGYVPSASATPFTPPKGGSGATPPPKK
ncbi:MAG TPA: hypothetical protein VHM92_09475 [Allosphingosinicella sp.]|nr:hypothetical protein [Allosphingosinicella sp.]